MVSEMGENRDFFISYTGEDENWATWVADLLTRHGYSVYIQAWHSPTGDSFISWMEYAIAHSCNFIAICSHAYFHHKTQYAMSELRTGYGKKMRGEIERFLLIRIENCSIPELYSEFGRIDAFTFDGNQKEQAEERLLRGIGCNQYYRASPFPNFMKRSNQLCDGENICLLGEAYLDGKIGSDLEDEQLMDIAFLCFELAYNLGNAKATYYLGYCFEYGYGTTPDYVKARQYYETAQKMGSVEAFYAEGSLYERDLGLQWSDQREIDSRMNEYAKKISQYGESYIEYMTKYEGIRTDLAKYLLSIRNDESKIRNVLSDVIKKQYTLQHAIQDYLTASEKGYAQASLSLGKMYASGKGVEQDYEKARSYFQTAHEQGSDSALEEMEKLPMPFS